MFLTYFIFPAFLGLLFILFRYRVTKAGKPYKKSMEEYIERDRQSNFARKKEIPAELFVKPDISRLPFRDYPQQGNYKLLAAKQSRCEKAAALPMIKLGQGINNIELKTLYGAVNLEVIASYEENYNKYLHLLVSYAEELIKHELYDDAETVLCESLDLGSDLSLSYTLLADIYSVQGKKDMLTGLYDRIADDVSVYMDNPVLKSKVMDYISGKSLFTNLS